MLPAQNILNQCQRMPKPDELQHKLIAGWAANCAENVLLIFEEKYPEDCRPRQAIEAARLWVKGEIKVGEARKFAFAAHAAARNAEDPQAKAAARSAGHAAATPHVPGHAKYAAFYALKAVPDPVADSTWQQQNIPDSIRSLIW